MDNQNQNLPANQKEDKKMTYQVGGQDVNLSPKIVKDYLTKGGGNVSDQDIILFMSVCKYNQINPFLGEAYLVKFGSTPAQMVVSKEAFFKRADACTNYDGIEAGVIVVREGEVKELEGTFYLDTDLLVGGWAIVHRSDKKYPFTARVTMKEYNKKQSTWNEKPATMISKVAKVQALREAFPNQLGAMYTIEETASIEDAAYEEIKDKANKEPINAFEGQGKQTPTEEVKEATSQDKEQIKSVKLETPNIFNQAK